MNHTCRERCKFCLDDGDETAQCGKKCGHSGKHNCRSKDHTCGKLSCSLSKHRGCQKKCMLPLSV